MRENTVMVKSDVHQKNIERGLDGWIFLKGMLDVVILTTSQFPTKMLQVLHFSLFQVKCKA